MTRRGRILIADHVRPPGFIGGAELATTDMAADLARRGWEVVLLSEMARETAPALPGLADRSDHVPPSPGPRPAWVRFGRRALPRRWRLVLSAAAGLWRELPLHSVYLDALEAALRGGRRFDAVVVCTMAIPGVAALAAHLHPAVVLASTWELETDLLAGASWRATRLVARLRLGRRAHPFLHRPIAAAAVRMAWFRSAAWRDEAIAAGLPPGVARVIRTGVDVPVELPARPAPGRRLLWVGRLVPEKGLHLVVAALPALRARLGDVTLTAVTAQGAPGYRADLEGAIDRLGLAGAVRLVPPVPRHRLGELYASHDALCFYSVFAEPAALVVMEAMAAGLPVVTSRPRAAGPLLRDDQTCVAYDPGDPGSLVSACARMLSDHALADRLRAAGWATVRRAFSMTAAGDAMEAALAEVMAPAAAAGPSR